MEEMFSRISHRYDLLNNVMSGGMHYRWKALTARFASESLIGPALDVASGTGDIAFALARQPGITDVTGLDFSSGMVNLASQKAVERSEPRPVSFLLGDALALPFPDRLFACATTGFSLRNVVDIHRCVAEMARVVRPGGRVALLEFTPLPPGGLFPRLFRLYFHGFVPLVGRILAGDSEAYTYLPRSVDGFVTAPDLARIMEDVGLQNVRFRRYGMGTVALHVGERA